MKSSRVLLLIALLVASGGLYANVFTVNSDGDAADATPGDGNCATAGAVCTLRAAVQEANALAAGAPHTIRFAGPRLITLASPIVSSRAGTVIDGAFGNTPYTVELVGATNTALDVTGGSNVIRGLVVRGFQGFSIVLASAGNFVQGNRIGTNAAGTAASANASGISVEGPDSQIGGANPGEGNVISGNTAWGIYVEAGGSGTTVNGTKIRGNLVGLTADGAAALGNGLSGIALGTGVGNVIIGGETSAAERNVIGGHTTVGRAGIVVQTSDDSLRNVIVGNYVGTDLSGNVALPNYRGIDLQSSGLTGVGGPSAGAGNLVSGNLDAGIRIEDGNLDILLGNVVGLNAAGNAALPNATGIRIGSSKATVVGGSDPGAGNVIAGNTGVGLHISNTDPILGIKVVSNLIGLSRNVAAVFNNGGGGIQVSGSGSVWMSQNRIASTVPALAIDLGADGVTPNDPGDADFAGPNGLQNFPNIATAVAGAGSTAISGTFNSSASTLYRLEFFSAPACHPSGYGDAREYLGSVDVTTDGSGNAPFQYIHGATLPAGSFVTATAVYNTNRLTSELSACRSVTAGGPIGGGTGAAVQPVPALGRSGLLLLIVMMLAVGAFWPGRFSSRRRFQD